MLLSMTGHGAARRQQDDLTVSVEVRSVNSRYFKLSVRAGEANSGLEPRIEGVVRRRIRRGTVQVDVQMDRAPAPDDYRINEVVLASYRRQIERLHDQLRIADSVSLGPLLSLPGVVDERAAARGGSESDWRQVEPVLLEALEGLARMRAEEGTAMASDLEANRRMIAQQLDWIEGRAPEVVEAYRSRLTERINRLLAEYEVGVDSSDIAREVGLFAERSDISEEIVRLRSHLDQFRAIVEMQESHGRKLEFLVQEMFREANTIGSKSNDAEIARRVIEIKAAIERMREMVQNIE